MSVTVKQVAEHVLGRPAVTMADYEEVGLPFMGGCEVCNASVAAYNSCPSKTGFIRCLHECIDGEGFDTVEEAVDHIFAPLDSPDEPLRRGPNRGPRSIEVHAFNIADDDVEVQILLTEEDQEDLARIFELGVNVPEGSRQVSLIRLVANP